MNGNMNYSKGIIYLVMSIYVSNYRCGVGIPWEDMEANDAVLLGFLVAIFLKHFRECVTAYQPLVVAHFHEWQAGQYLNS